MRVRLGKKGNVRSDGYVQTVGVLRARARGMDARRTIVMAVLCGNLQQLIYSIPNNCTVQYCTAR